MKRPIRIASLLARLHIAGDENRLLHFHRAMDSKCFEHCLILMVPPTEEDNSSFGGIINRYHEQGVEIIVLNEMGRKDRWERFGPLAVFGDAISFLRTTRLLMRIVRKREIDIIDARMNTAIIFGALVGWLTRVPVLATDYSLDWFGRPGVKWLGWLAFSFIDVFVTDSDQRLRVFQDWARWGQPRWEMVRNGIFRPESQFDRTAARRHLGLPEDPAIRIVGQVSRVRKEKGQEVLLDAMKIVMEQEPNVFLIICGYSHPDLSFRDQLACKAQDLGIGDCVKIISYPGSIGDVWAAIDIQAHASWMDSSPISVHESMAFSKPAVVSEVGGIRELVKDEESGLVVPTRDPNALAAGILRLLREPDTARRFGRTARERFERYHRPEVMAKALGDIFEDMVRRRRSKANPTILRADP